eukprot:c54789_g1_i1 orf=59-271(+)
MKCSPRCHFAVPGTVVSFHLQKLMELTESSSFGAAANILCKSKSYKPTTVCQRSPANFLRLRWDPPPIAR